MYLYILLLNRSIGLVNSKCKTLLLVVSKTVFTLYIVIITLLSWYAIFPLTIQDILYTFILKTEISVGPIAIMWSKGN